MNNNPNKLIKIKVNKVKKVKNTFLNLNDIILSYKACGIIF